MRMHRCGFVARRTASCIAVLTAAAFGLGWVELRAAALPGLDWTQTPSGPITLPVFAARNGPPAAVVEIRSVRTELQRRGFFRIGMLPLTVAEGVTVELRDATALDQTVRSLPRLLRRRPASGFEGRSFALRFPQEPRPCLTAERLVCQSSGAATLHQGHWIGPDGETRSFATATLEPGLSGQVWLKADTGRWRLDRSGAFSPPPQTRTALP